MSNNLKYSYIIGSGWWCGENQKNENRVIVGDESIRGNLKWTNNQLDHLR